MDDDNKKIRPLYAELKGYMAVAPDASGSTSIYNEMASDLSKQLNQTIDELNGVSGRNYDKFKIHPRPTVLNRSSVIKIETLDYRNKLSGLISKLQGEFFENEGSSFQGPSTIINTHQNQTQTQQQSIAVDIAMLVAEKKSEYTIGTPERTFLDKLGEALKSAKSAQEIIQGIISIASATGVGFEFLKKVFGV